MVTLQGDPFALQGNNQQLQGGQAASILQPSASPVAGPVLPVPVAAPKPVVKAAPKVVKPVAPNPVASAVSFYKPDPNNPQVYTADGRPVSYDEYIALGGRPDFGNVINGQAPGIAPSPAAQPGIPQPGAAPSAPAAPDFATAAGQSGLGFDDFMKVLSGQNGLSAEEEKAIKDSFGLSGLEDSVFQASPSTQQLYTDAYSAAGLADVKQKISDLDARIAAKQKQIVDAQGAINENPFLSEESRVGRTKRLNEQAQAELDTLLSEKQQYSDLYTQGLNEVNNVVTRNTTDFNSSQELNAKKLAYLTSKANEAITQKQSEKVGAAYSTALPAFLAAKARSAKPETIGSAESGFFQWDPNTSKFVQITQPKPNLPDSAKEYEYAKSQGYTGSYADYQNEDANRKRSIARAGAAVYGSTGLSNAELTQVQKITGQFDGEPIVKNYNVIAEGKSFVDSIPNNTKNPADQQGLIYAFAKAMDPNSVVREGEYATVQKYAQSWAQSFGFNAARIFSNSPFLSEQAIANMKATINSKFNAAKSQYTNVYNEYGRRVDQITGKTGGTDFLTNYASYSQPVQSGGGASTSLDDLF